MRTKYYDLDGRDAEDGRVSAFSDEVDLLDSRNSMAVSLGTLLANDEGVASSNQDKQTNGGTNRHSSSGRDSAARAGGRRMSAAYNPADIGWEETMEAESRISRGHHRISTRLSNLDLDLFKSTMPFYTWSTTQQSRHASLSEHGGFENVVATKTNGGNHWSCTVKANMVMHEGQHYFEVELMPGSAGGVMIGVARENVDPDSCHHSWYGDRPQRAWLMFAMLGDDSSSFATGDRVGVQVDLDSGSVSFFKNGNLIRRPKQASGRIWQRVKGPVVPAVQLFDEGDAVKFISDAAEPNSRARYP